jgi:hypothetical protein
MVFIKAQSGPPNCGDSDKLFTVQYFDEQGNMTIRGGGSRAWRCNNPGNLRSSKYSTSAQRRSIGVAGDGEDEYAVYPDYETGHEALVVMLKGGIYSPLTLREAMKRYDSTNPKYIDTIVEKTGFDPERKVKSLNDKEFEKFWWAIEDTEKWKVGREDFIEKWVITGVHLKRGVISEYCIRQNGNDVWISKQEAINLAQEYRIHAIVVHCLNGTIYLRPEYHAKRFREMVC